MVEMTRRNATGATRARGRSTSDLVLVYSPSALALLAQPRAYTLFGHSQRTTAQATSFDVVLYVVDFPLHSAELVPATSPLPSPSADEIRTAIPHPNAYYCKEHNGWVLLYWCSSTVLPPIVSSYQFEHPLPDQTRRKRTASCVASEEQAVGRANQTHHFHKYASAVDARTLNTPFKRSDWESEVRQKRRNRSVTLRIEGDAGETSTQGEKVEEPEGDLLDLYVCCQCSVYCLVSRNVIPGVIPLRKVEEFVKDKLEHPPLGKTGAVAVVSGWETIITYVLHLHLCSVYLIRIINRYRNIFALPNLQPCRAQYLGEPALERRESCAPRWTSQVSSQDWMVIDGVRSFPLGRL